MHPQMELQFDNQVRDALCGIIARKGLAVCDNQTSLLSLLRDYCPDDSFDRAIALVMDAMQLGVPSDLRSAADGALPLETVLAKCRQKLMYKRAKSAEGALWAALSWAVALNCITAEEMDARMEPAAPLSQPSSPLPQPAPSPAPVAQFSASPLSIPKGGTSTLKWNTQHATSVSIAPGIGDVPASGERAVTPSERTTYRLIAKGPGGTAEAKVEVLLSQPQVVLAGPPPKPYVQFSVTPTAIRQGEAATLKWSVQHATTVSIAPGVGDVPAAGERTVSPSGVTGYRLTAKGPGGTAEAVAVVTVNPPAVASPPPKEEPKKAPVPVPAPRKPSMSPGEIVGLVISMVVGLLMLYGAFFYAVPYVAKLLGTSDSNVIIGAFIVGAILKSMFK